MRKIHEDGNLDSTFLYIFFRTFLPVGHAGAGAEARLLQDAGPVVPEQSNVTRRDPRAPGAAGTGCLAKAMRCV
jgi:hypothetical protein